MALRRRAGRAVQEGARGRVHRRGAEEPERQDPAPRAQGAASGRRAPPEADRSLSPGHGIRRIADGPRRFPTRSPTRPERNAMPAPTPEELGPLAGLAGTWEGSKGLDVSFHNADDEIGDTPYREKVTLAPFGPGRQRPPEAVRPRLPHGGVAGRRGGPVPHRDRLLDVGRDPQRDLPLRDGAPGHGGARRWRGRSGRHDLHARARSSDPPATACSRTRTSASTRARGASRSRSPWARTRGRTRRP